MTGTRKGIRPTAVRYGMYQAGGRGNAAWLFDFQFTGCIAALCTAGSYGVQPAR